MYITIQTNNIYSTDEEYESNIDIILYIKELRLSEKISGYCKIPVMIGIICLYDEKIILRDETLNFQRPTLAVACNVICTEFFPFLSLFNNRGDCFSLSKEYVILLIITLANLPMPTWASIWTRFTTKKVQ